MFKFVFVSSERNMCKPTILPFVRIDEPPKVNVCRFHAISLGRYSLFEVRGVLLGPSR